MARRRSLVLLAVVGAALTGCYGSTEPASDIGINAATFNGKGTTNSGSASVYFEFWPTSMPSVVGTTHGRIIPAGASGSISDASVGDQGGLEPATEYAFRVCGKDDGAQQPQCAQSRTFQTVRPTDDVLAGSFTVGRTGERGSVIARSDPSGSNPAGSLTVPGGDTAKVTCLAVSGSQAAVGGIETVAPGVFSTLTMVVRDGGLRFNGDPTGGDAVGWSSVPGAGPPDCVHASFQNLGGPGRSDLAVYDSP